MRLFLHSIISWRSVIFHPCKVISSFNHWLELLFMHTRLFLHLFIGWRSVLLYIHTRLILHSIIGRRSVLLFIHTRLFLHLIIGRSSDLLFIHMRLFLHSIIRWWPFFFIHPHKVISSFNHWSVVGCFIHPLNGYYFTQLLVEDWLYFWQGYSFTVCKTWMRQ